MDENKVVEQNINEDELFHFVEYDAVSRQIMSELG